MLRSIAEVLPYRTTTPGLCFDKIIHIDCSYWKNRRGLQRAIAEELELQSSTMAILDEQDEEDDFNGVAESSRNEMTSVSREIYEILKYNKFALIFHNGSDNEFVDLTNFGVPPITSFGDNLMIWCYRRGILTIQNDRKHELVKELRYTHVLLCGMIEDLLSGDWYALLCKEAAIIIAGNPCIQIQGVNPMMVVDCCLYKLFLQCSFDKTNSAWGDLVSSYWICDGILQKDITLEINDALHREIRWEWDDDVLTKLKKHLKLPFLVVQEDGVYEEDSYRWISITLRDREILGMNNLPAETSSFFLEFEISDQPTALPNGLFEHSRNLGVLILCCCAFNFASPPFLKCHSIRFLGLDHCTDDRIGEGEDHTEWDCLDSLWVLDLRYTAWNEILSPEKMGLMDNLMELSIEGVWCWQYTTRLQGQLPNLRWFRVIKPACRPDISAYLGNSFMHKEKLEILDLSGNSEMKILPNGISKASSLQVLILDDCNDLKNVLVPDGLPHSLKSFSFDGYGPAFHRASIVELPAKQERPSTPTTKEGASVSSISLKGCTQLENMFVRGLPNLVELDLSGTAIKTLDFSTMVLEVPMLKQLFLLGCKNLCAIIWSMADIPSLNLLCIDTRAGAGCRPPSIDQNKSFRLQVHASVVDARLVRSLENPLFHHYEPEDVCFNIHATSPVSNGPVQSIVTYKEKKVVMHGDQLGLLQLVQDGRYSDLQDIVGDAPMQVFPNPPTDKFNRHIEIAEGSHVFDRALVRVMTRFVESLHVHDVSTIGSMFSGKWTFLRQCRMERCPKLDEFFRSDQVDFCSWRPSGR
ncbi:hypothetical protein ZWY2020_000546 [Hordeum vulgare]|nr:hypothetical protein ZWY2020_000546 [Hordeum vulgare]